MAVLQITTCSAYETEQLGACIGSLLQPGSFLALQGILGGGKTCLTRGVVASLAPQSSGLVASPTYAIMNCYPGVTPVYHFDFYRLYGDKHLSCLRQICSYRNAGLKFVYAGNRPGELGDRENTFCPTCHATLIRRWGFTIKENRLKDGCCPDCGCTIPGVWE